MITKLHFINFQLFPKIAIVFTILLANSVNVVKAQDIPRYVINGLFTPTESQRFFEEGRRKFESDAIILNNPEYYFNDDILQISPELLRQEQEQNHSDFGQENNLPSSDK